MKETCNSMTSVTPLGNNATTNSTFTGDRGITDNPPERRAFLAMMGILSILCNCALCIVIIRKRRMLKNSYNVFVLILAVMDTITGIFIYFWELWIELMCQKQNMLLKVYVVIRTKWKIFAEKNFAAVDVINIVAFKVLMRQSPNSKD